MNAQEIEDTSAYIPNKSFGAILPVQRLLASLKGPEITGASKVKYATITLSCQTWGSKGRMFLEFSSKAPDEKPLPSEKTLWASVDVRLIRPRSDHSDVSFTVHYDALRSAVSSFEDVNRIALYMGWMRKPEVGELKLIIRPFGEKDPRTIGVRLV